MGGNRYLPVRVYWSEDQLRQTAADVARFACNLATERLRSGRQFDDIAVGGDDATGPTVSGELANFLLIFLGVRDPALVSLGARRENAPWRQARNLRRIVFPKREAFVWASGTRLPQQGDILHVASPERVCILDRIDEFAELISTFEFGGQDRARGKPAVCRTVYPYRKRDNRLYLGESRVRGWLDITRIDGLLEHTTSCVLAIPTGHVKDTVAKTV